jgi:hypothetical protein
MLVIGLANAWHFSSTDILAADGQDPPTHRESRSTAAP